MKIVKVLSKRTFDIALLSVAVICLIFITQMADARTGIGSVLKLDGVGDSGKTAVSPTDLDITGDITLQCYFYKDSSVDYAAAGFDALIFKPSAYDLRLEWATDTTAYVRGRVFTTVGGQQLVSTSSALTFNDDNWYNIGFTRSGANMEIFVDAVTVATKSDADTSAGVSNTQPVYVGDNAGGSASTAGFIDEARISNAVIDIVTEGNPNTFSVVASTKALWRFDEPTGSTSFADAAGVNDTLSQVGNAVTLIDLSYFKAIPKGNKIVLKWKTDSETSNAGFNILRSDSKNGNYVMINNETIASTANDAIGGGKYSYDDTDVEIGKKYFYKLVDIEIDNTENINAPNPKAKIKEKNKRQKKHKKQGK